jgi:dTDP-glucose 4,6-dehydratase
MNVKVSLSYEDFHKFRPGHDMHYGLNGSKIKKLGWTPPLSMDETLEKTIKWMLNNKNWLGE